jgi:hypothetical protein
MLANAARPFNFDLGETADMLRDTVSAFARALLGPEALLQRAAPPPPGPAAAARDLLLAWDGDVRADRPEGLIFNAWIVAVGRLALAAGGVPEAAVRSRGRLLELVLSPDGRGAAWCGGDCVALTARALEEAMAGLVATQGPDPAAWRWGAAHVARFEHPFLLRPEVAQYLQWRLRQEFAVVLRRYTPAPLARSLQQEHVVGIEMRSDPATVAGPGDHQVIKTCGWYERKAVQQCICAGMVQIDALHQYGPGMCGGASQRTGRERTLLQQP